MEAAAILAIVLLDYADFALIVGLLLINSTISYVEESSADKAIKVSWLDYEELPELTVWDLARSNLTPKPTRVLPQPV